jgi:hypothetical protein
VKNSSGSPENTPKPPIYITDVKNISPIIQLLDLIAKQQAVGLKFSLKLLNPIEQL